MRAPTLGEPRETCRLGNGREVTPISCVCEFGSACLRDHWQQAGSGVSDSGTNEGLLIQSGIHSRPWTYSPIRGQPSTSPATKKPAQGGLSIYLSKFGDLRFNLLQRSFQRRTARWIGCSLRQDIFPLQFQRLLLPCTLRAFVFRSPFGLDIHVYRPGMRSRMLDTCHLFLHRFTFPPASHISLFYGCFRSGRPTEME
jgi:hypothetical protein